MPAPRAAIFFPGVDVEEEGEDERGSERTGLVETGWTGEEAGAGGRAMGEDFAEKRSELKRGFDDTAAVAVDAVEDNDDGCLGFATENKSESPNKSTPFEAGAETTAAAAGTAAAAAALLPTLGARCSTEGAAQSSSPNSDAGCLAPTFFPGAPPPNRSTPPNMLTAPAGPFLAGGGREETGGEDSTTAEEEIPEIEGSGTFGVGATVAGVAAAAATGVGAATMGVGATEGGAGFGGAEKRDPKIAVAKKIASRRRRKEAPF